MKVMIVIPRFWEALFAVALTWLLATVGGAGWWALLILPYGAVKKYSGINWGMSFARFMMKEQAEDFLNKLKERVKNEPTDA